MLDIVDAHIDLPGTARQPQRAQRRNPRPCRLIGSGRTELARAVFGIDKPRAGAIRLEGEPIVVGSPRDAIDRGIYLIPEDRKRSGLLLERIDHGEYFAAGSRILRACHRAGERRDRQRQ